MSASKTDYFCEAYKAAGRQDHYPSGNKETEMVQFRTLSNASKSVNTYEL